MHTWNKTHAKKNYEPLEPVESDQNLKLIHDWPI